MTIRLGIGTYAFAWSVGVPGYQQPVQPMSYEGFLQATVDIGLSVAQIADNLPLHMLGASDRQKLRDMAASHNLTVEVGTRGIALDHLHTYINLADEFDSSILRVVVDTADHHPDVPEIIKTLSEILPVLAERNIILAIENHDRFRASQLVTVMQALDSQYIGICLDTVNSFGSLEGPEIVVEQLGQYVVNLHVKDFSIKRLNHNMGFHLEGTPAGQGMLDVPWLLGELNKYGRDYNAIIELWPAPEQDMEATIRKERAWAEESVTTMRQWIKE